MATEYRNQLKERPMTLPKNESWPSEEETLALWNAVCETDAELTQSVEYGKRKFTAIDATYQKRRATALFGPYGATWGLKNLQWGIICAKDGLPAEVTLSATFFYPSTHLGPGGEFEIANDIAWERGQDCRKKCWTETIKKALSMLGFSADVYMGRFDDEKSPNAPADPRRDTVEAIKKAFQDAPTIERLDLLLKHAGKRGLSKYWMGEVKIAYDARRSMIEQGDLFGGPAEPSGQSAGSQPATDNPF
jgi:hypothetical protein